MGVLHGVDFLFAHLLVGVLIFEAWVLPAGKADASHIGFERRAAWLKRLAALLFLSSLAWLLFVCAGMAESWQPADLWAAITGSTFGQRWMIRLVLIAALLVAFLRRQQPRPAYVLPLLLGLGALLMSTLTGHAAAQDTGAAWRVLLQWVHSVAVAVWSGGLVALYFWIGDRNASSEATAGVSFRVVTRFSLFAMASTAIIVVTGIVMSIEAGVQLTAPWKSAYGEAILAKTVLLGLALLAAAVNQLIHLRGYREDRELAFGVAIRRSVAIEVLAVIAAFIVAGFLTRLNPPAGM